MACGKVPIESEDMSMPSDPARRFVSVPASGPSCPDCGAVMNLVEVASGVRFWGCTRLRGHGCRAIVWPNGRVAYSAPTGRRVHTVREGASSAPATAAAELALARELEALSAAATARARAEDAARDAAAAAADAARRAVRDAAAALTSARDACKGLGAGLGVLVAAFAASRVEIKASQDATIARPGAAGPWFTLPAATGNKALDWAVALTRGTGRGQTICVMSATVAADIRRMGTVDSGVNRFALLDLD